jgi:hypothetical protein
MKLMLIGVLAIAACSKTTGTGTLGTIQDVRALSPEVKFPADGALKQNSLDRTENGAKLKLNWWTYDAPKGGKYIASYGWEVVEDKKGTVLHDGGHLNAENGGTEEAPIMRLPVQITWESEGAVSKTGGTDVVTIAADGTHQ